MLCADNTQRHTRARYMYTTMMILYQPTPFLPVLASAWPFYMIQPSFLFTWRSCFFWLWCKYPSILVPGLLSTVLPLLLHPPQGTPQINLHIYIDNINNVSYPVGHNKCMWTWDFGSWAQIWDKPSQASGHGKKGKASASGPICETRWYSQSVMGMGQGWTTMHGHR